MKTKDISIKHTLTRSFKKGDYVHNNNDEYFFKGWVVSIFKKHVNTCVDNRRLGKVISVFNNTGHRYVVVQNMDGILHIFNEGQLKLHTSE